MEDIMKAAEFANAAHEAAKQRRKYTGDPYIVHPLAVMAIVSGIPHTSVMLQAALLHDTVKYTAVKLEDVLREFGPEVAGLVRWLTDVSQPSDGNRAVRKAIDRRHIEAAPSEAKTIKLADLINETESIARHFTSFAEFNIAEKFKLLEVLRDGDPVLWDRANSLFQESIATGLDGAAHEEYADSSYMHPCQSGAMPRRP